MCLDSIVTIYRVNDQLAVSRAIGDSEFKVTGGVIHGNMNRT
jgi:hypothetical protein